MRPVSELIPRLLACASWSAAATIWQRAERILIPSVKAEREYRGISVQDRTEGGSPAVIVATVCEALAFVSATDPRRFARLQRDVDRVVIVDMDIRARAFFMAGARACYVLDRVVRESEPEWPVVTAMSIVHEAVHARLDRLRRMAWGKVRGRMEARASLEEIHFASRLTGESYAEVRSWVVARVLGRRHVTSAVREAALRLAAT
jgi:hypothetical protein